MAHISWQGHPKEGSPGHISPVSCLWGLSCLLLLIPSPTLVLLLRVQLLIADSCLWGLKTASSAEWMDVCRGCVGHWDFNNDLREVSTQDLLTVWRIGLQLKGHSWQWEAVNSEIFIKALTRPLRRAAFLTGTTNMEASVLKRGAISCTLHFNLLKSVLSTWSF